MARIKARIHVSLAPRDFKQIRGSTGAATVGAGATVYIYMEDRGLDSGAVEHDAHTKYLITRAGLIKNLVVLSEVAPGAGETFTYMVRINDDVSTITAEIGGAAEVEEVDNTHVETVSVGDMITIELITSGGAAVTDHAFALQFEG